MDELFLRHEIRAWSMRFITGQSPNILVLAKNKQDFARQFGYQELNRVVNEVELSVAKEMKGVRH